MGTNTLATDYPIDMADVNITAVANGFDVGHSILTKYYFYVKVL
jgi:hypothetical protein